MKKVRSIKIIANRQLDLIQTRKGLAKA